MKKLIMTAALATGLAGGAIAATPEAERLVAAGRVIHEVREEMPPGEWARARCVAVMPGLKKADFLAGSQYGHGVMSCRVADGWSAPVFIELAESSWGFQVDADQMDVVLLVMKDTGVHKMLQNRAILGADTSAAPGSVGAQTIQLSAAQRDAEILSYVYAHDTLTGFDLSRAELRPDGEADRSAYGGKAVPRLILEMRQRAAPADASPFLAALDGNRSPT